MSNDHAKKARSFRQKGVVRKRNRVRRLAKPKPRVEEMNVPKRTRGGAEATLVRSDMSPDQTDFFFILLCLYPYGGVFNKS